MTGRRRLTEQQRIKIVARYDAGEKIDVIAAEFGICRHYPVMLVRRRGREPRQRAQKGSQRLDHAMLTA